MCPTAAALAAFEIAVRRRRTALARCELIRVHRQAHAAAGLTPLETSVFENAVEPFLLCLLLHQPAAWNDHGVYVSGNLMSVHDRCRSTEVFDSCIRARTDKHSIELQIA